MPSSRYPRPGTAVLLLLALPCVWMPARAEVVRYWHVGNYDEVVVLKKLAEQFREQTGIRVEIQPVPWGHYKTKYFTAMAAGTPPDVGTTDLGGPADYGKDGGLIDLQARFPQAVARLRRTLFPRMWPICYLGKRLYGVPFSATALMGFYRKDIFARLGLQPPETWSQLVTVIERLNAEGYPYGFVWTRNSGWALGTYTGPFNAWRVSEEGRRVHWTAPGFQRGVRFAVQLWNSYNIVTEKAVELFGVRDPTKALPLYFNYSLDYAEIQRRAPQLRHSFGVFPFPRADGRQPTTSMGGAAWVIFRKARNPEGAMRWIEFVMSARVQLERYRLRAAQGDQSELTLSINREFWRADLGLRPGDQPVLHRVFSGLQTPPAYPWIREAVTALDRALYQIQDELTRYLEREARQMRVSVSQLKRRFAAGELPAQKAAYQDHLREIVARVLRAASERAQPILDRDYHDYQRSQGRRQAAGPRWDVLDLAEGAAILVVLGFGLLLLLRRGLRRCWTSYAFTAPPVLSALVFTFVPAAVSLYLSFTRYNPIQPLAETDWVGLQNYARLLATPGLWQSLGRSVYFAALVLPVQLCAGVVLAACLDRKLIPDRLYKFVYFAPLVTSIVAVSLIWFALYAATHYGWINAILLRSGAVVDPVQFLQDERFFLNSVIVVSIWQGLPFYILVFLAGLQSIPHEQYEAAALDGAGPMRQFLYITLPSLKPQFVFLVVMGTIGAVQVFEQIYMLGGGAEESGSKFGPDDSGLTMVPYLYRRGFEFFKMGEASAVAYLLFVMLVVLTYLQLRRISRGDGDESATR